MHNTISPNPNDTTSTQASIGRTGWKIVAAVAVLAGLGSADVAVVRSEAHTASGPHAAVGAPTEVGLPDNSPGDYSIGFDPSIVAAMNAAEGSSDYDVAFDPSIAAAMNAAEGSSDYDVAFDPSIAAAMNHAV